MNIVVTFVLILAWAGAVIGALMWALTFYWGYQYENNNLEKAIDALRGVRRRYPMMKWFLIFATCLAYLIAFYTNR